jgi:hypothetical protein
MTDCYCDYDTPEFYTRDPRTAKKRHKCYECNGPVLPGEKYEHVAAKWDSQIDVFKTCVLCYSIRKWVEHNIPCTCWAHGNMMDDLWQSIEDAIDRAPEETVGLRFGFLRRYVIHKRAVRQRREANKMELLQ